MGGHGDGCSRWPGRRIARIGPVVMPSARTARTTWRAARISIMIIRSLWRRHLLLWPGILTGTVPKIVSFGRWRRITPARWRTLPVSHCFLRGGYWNWWHVLSSGWWSLSVDGRLLRRHGARMAGGRRMRPRASHYHSTRVWMRWRATGRNRWRHARDMLRPSDWGAGTIPHSRSIIVFSREPLPFVSWRWIFASFIFLAFALALTFAW